MRRGGLYIAAIKLNDFDPRIFPQGFVSLVTYSV
jgi:hypothetical protein